MTKKELAEALENGKTMCELFQFSLGQECDVFKADDFKVGDEILYISDMYNCRLYIRPIKGMDDIEDILDCCYTGNDFLDAAGGNPILAEHLFNICDWQSPYTEAEEYQRVNAVEEVG